MNFRLRVQRAFAAMGYDIRRRSGELGENPYEDMRRLCGTGTGEPPILFDVGANVGQTIYRFRTVFSDPIIHAFEPGPATFAELERSTSGTPRLFLNRCGVGARDGELELIENTHPDMSSFLPPGPEGWGEIRARTSVAVRSLDSYCREHGIHRIDVLKTDTQGFDLEVVRGAQGLLDEHRVRLVFMEVTFSEMYRGIPQLDEIFAFMRCRGFALVCFYQFHHKGNRAEWTDALFVDPSFDAERSAKRDG